MLVPISTISAVIPNGSRAAGRRCALLRSTHRETLRAQAGFTLIELLMSAALSVVVLGGVLSALEHSQHAQSRDQEWALVIQEGRAGLSRMVREMRQAYSIRSDSHSAIDFYATIGGTSWEIAYNCEQKQAGSEFRECVRKAAQFTEGKAPSKEEVEKASAVPIIKDVLNNTEADKNDRVFEEFTPNAIAPDLVTVKLVLPASGTLKLADASTYTHKVVLENGAYIRDMDLEA